MKYEKIEILHRDKIFWVEANFAGKQHLRPDEIFSMDESWVTVQEPKLKGPQGSAQKTSKSPNSSQEALASALLVKERIDDKKKLKEVIKTSGCRQKM